MSDLARRSKDSEATEHCDYDTLFAFLRKTLDNEEAHQVYQHLNECQECTSRFDRFRLLTGELKAEEQYRSIVPDFLAYIDNPGPAQLLEHKKRLERFYDDLLLVKALVAYGLTKITGRTSTQHGKPKQRPRQGAGARVPLFTTGMLVIVMVCVVVLALVVPRLRNGNPKGERPHNHITTVVTATPYPSPTVGIVPPTTIPTTGPTNSSEPGTAAIWICKTSSSGLYERITICGKYFQPGDRIQLWAYFQNGGHGLPHLVIANLTVIAGGKLQYTWSVIQCRNVTIVISAYDQSKKTAVGNTIKNLKSGKCSSIHIVTGR